MEASGATLARASARALRVGIALLALALGVGYALTAYWLGPALLPAGLGAALALALGIWRLEAGLAVVLFINPLTENEATGQLTDNPISLFLAVWSIAIALIALAREYFADRRLEAPPLLVGAAAYVAAGLLALAIAPSDAVTYGQFLAFYGAVGIYVLIACFLNEWRQLTVVLGAVAVVGGLIALHSLWQYQTGDLSRVGFVTATGGVEYRVQSTFPHPNQLAGFLTVMVPLGVGIAGFPARGSIRAAGIALAAIAVLAVAVTYSRGALVGLAALPLVYVRTWRAWPLIGVVAVLLVLLAPGAWRDRVAGIGDTSSPEIATRLDFWEAAVSIFEDEPLTGVGFRGFQTAYDSQERVGRTGLAGQPLQAPDTAHNLYLNTMAEQGLIGLVALVILLVAFLRMALALRRAAGARARAIGQMMLGVGIVFAVHNFFDVTLLPKTTVVMWALFGIGALAFRLERQRSA